MEWMILPFKRYVDFSGRSRRMEYWMFQLFNLIVTAILLALIFAGFPWEDIQNGVASPAADPTNPFAIFEILGPTFWIGIVLMMFWGLGVFIPSIEVTVRRLHDRGVSGWWYAGLLLAGFVPFVNFLTLPGYLVLLVFMLLPGKPEPNKWGDNPKAGGTALVFE